jgi:hypothetical protein
MDIAVVVQRQVESVKAGVMFTIDPATGADDRLVIEAAFGLGESVVAGQVSPDRYVVDKATLADLAREVRRKDLTVEAVSGAARSLAGHDRLGGARHRQAPAPSRLRRGPERELPRGRLGGAAGGRRVRPGSGLGGDAARRGLAPPGRGGG